MQQPIYSFGEFHLNPATRELRRGDERVVLPLRVFACLQYLIEQRDRAVSREELIKAVWNRDNISDVRLGQLVLRARRAIDDDGSQPSRIRTVIGFGYHWVAPIGVVDGGAAATVPASIDPAATPAAAASAAVPRRDAASSMSPPAAAETAPAASLTPHRRRVPRHAIAASIAVLATLAGVTALTLHRPSRDGHGETAQATQDIHGRRLAVLPLKVPAGAESAWVRFGGMDFVAERLREAGIAVIPSETTLALLRHGAHPTPDATPATLRQHAGASLVIDGELVQEGPDWRVHLHADDEHLYADGNGAEPMQALRLATDALLARIGGIPPDANLAPDVAETVQRVRAALLADDPVRARRLLDAINDPALRDAPEIRFASVQTLVRSGRFDDADHAATSLLATLSVDDAPRLRMSALTARAVARVRTGRLDEARADADAALAVPNAPGHASECASALNARAIVAIARHDFDTASGWLGQARLQFERIGDALNVARVDNNLGLLDYERGALSEADQQIEQSLRIFQSFGAVRELSSALGGRMLVLSAQLRHAEALAASDRFWARIDATGDPLQRRGNLLRRAEALMAVGRLAETHALLARVHRENVPDSVPTRDAERLALLETGLALRESRPDEAARLAADLPSAPPPTGDDDLRARAALVRQRALGAAAGTDEADTRELEAISAAPATHASALRTLALAERAAARGQAGLAERAYRVALQQAEASGLPRLVADVVESSAPWLIERGRIADAAAQIGRVGIWADRDFDCALLQLSLARVQGSMDFERSAAANAQRLAGERSVPAHFGNPGAVATH